MPKWVVVKSWLLVAGWCHVEIPKLSADKHRTNIVQLRNFRKSHNNNDLGGDNQQSFVFIVSNTTLCSTPTTLFINTLQSILLNVFGSKYKKLKIVAICNKQIANLNSQACSVSHHLILNSFTKYSRFMNQ